MNKLISCVALLSCSLMGCGDHGSRGITAHLPGDEEPTQPEWITVIPPQQSTDGNYWPVNALNAYFDESNYVGVVGYGAYYTTQSITVPALCIKFLGEHCVDGKRDGTTYTLSNTWVGGQAARFYDSGDETIIEWDRDLHRSTDSTQDLQQFSPAVHTIDSVNVPLTPPKGTTADPATAIDYFFTTYDRNAYYLYSKVVDDLITKGITTKMDTYDILDSTGEAGVEQVAVDFPSDPGQNTALNALIFYNNSEIGEIKGGQGPNPLQVPAGLSQFRAVAVQPGVDSPAFFAAYADQLYLNPGTGGPWQNITVSTNNMTIADVVVNWGDKEAQVVVMTIAGTVYYNPSISLEPPYSQNTWVQLGSNMSNGGFAYLQTHFSSNNTYPQIVVVGSAGSSAYPSQVFYVWYFNGTSGSAWKQIGGFAGYVVTDVYKMAVISWPSAAESLPSYLLSYWYDEPTYYQYLLDYFDGTESINLYASTQFAINDFAYGNDSATSDLSQILIGLTNGSVLQTSLD